MVSTSINRFVAAFVVLIAGTPAFSQAETRWVATWASSQQLVEPHNSIPSADVRDLTVRQIVHVSIGGAELRIRLSNRFGTAPLHFGAVHVAKAVAPNSAAIVPATDKAIAFSGQHDVTVPAGADYISDPVQFPLAALSDLAITIYLDSLPAEQTGHPGSRTTSYLAHGNLVSAADLPKAKTVEHWYFIAGVDVAAADRAAAVVALGDSITDGRGTTTNGNNRWTDVLARRLQANASTQGIGVLNQGIGGNRVLLDQIGPNALARFDHDVLAPPGVRHLIVLEGINDIGMLNRADKVSQAEHDALVHRLVAAYEQIIERAHAHGIKVFGATLLPFVGVSFYHPGPESEADRQTLNRWIRESGHFDAVIDFDKAMRDPQHPERLLRAYDSGDHLHPSPAGYAAMANAVPLSLFMSDAAKGTVPRIALTFDDLPAHGSLPAGETRMQVISKIIAALQHANVPPPYGFVNGQWLQKEPEDAAVLQAWRAAGYPLGNHSWSHMNLNQHTLEDFEADVARNEPLFSEWMDRGDWHWFRFPFLAEGDTPEKRAGVRGFLLQHGYRIAGVTMSFGDYQWTEPYTRCRTKGDSNAITLLQNSYLQAADESIVYYRGMAQALFGRDVPYVLLLHVGAATAEMLPRLLDLYRAKGFQFITLQEAESAPFYLEDTDLHLPPGPDSLEGLMADRHLPLPTRAAPAVQFDSLCQ